MRGNKGAAALAAAVASIAHRVTAKPDVLELGTIQPDASLQLDHFQHPIPRGDYLVAEYLTLPAEWPTFQTGIGGGGGDAPAHSHSVTVPTPKALRPLEPGDRVLVAWVNNGATGNADPVVVCRVVSS